MIEPVEWTLKPSTILSSVFLGVNVLALLLIVAMPMPFTLQMIFAGIVLATMVGVKRMRDNHDLRFGYGVDGWWIKEPTESVELKSWKTLGNLLILRFKGRQALLIVPDMLDREGYRQLFQTVRFGLDQNE